VWTENRSTDRLQDKPGIGREYQEGLDYAGNRLEEVSGTLHAPCSVEVNQINRAINM